MSSPANNPRTPRVLPKRPLDADLQEFLLDREARGLSPRTVAWYGAKLATWRAYAIAQGLDDLAQVTPSLLRRYLVHLGEGHNPGGVHGHYRALRALLNWYADEYAPAGWANPIRRVKAPRVPEEPLEPVPVEDLRRMLAACPRRTFTGNRDRALLLFLCDTGCRRSEVAALNLADVDLATGSVMVRQGKGGKFRTTFVGNKARQALAAYLRHRVGVSTNEALWVTEGRTRLSYGGLREIVRRRARQAGVPEPSLHAFRRSFALNALRGGIDLISLQRLLGHADLSVLKRYLAQTDADLREAHGRSGPVDRLL